jgi:membrane protein
MSWIQRALGAADRLQAGWPPIAVPVAVWKKFQDDQAGYLAALVCYFGFVALFPLLLIFITVLDMTLKSDPTLHRDLLNSALMQYPVVGSEIGSSLGSINGSGLPLGVGIVVLLLGARGVAFAMQNALCTVWGIRREQRPGFFTRSLYGLGLLMVVGLGLVVTTFLSGIANGAGNLITGPLAHAGAVAISLVANVGVFWVAFRLATMRRVPWTSLRVGAMLAAVVWQVLQVAGGYVVTHELHRASTLYGTFGVVLGLVGWLYLQATVTLYCAEVDAVLVTRRWPRSLLNREAGDRAGPQDASSLQAPAPPVLPAPAPPVPPQARAPQAPASRSTDPDAASPGAEQKEAGHDTPVG